METLESSPFVAQGVKGDAHQKRDGLRPGIDNKEVVGDSEGLPVVRHELDVRVEPGRKLELPYFLDPANVLCGWGKEWENNC
jgi:hypothetical protein